MRSGRNALPFPPRFVALRFASSCPHGAFFATRLCRKRSGKPQETPPYTQAYLPYDTPPSQLEIDRERRRFLQQPWKGNKSKMLDVKDVPDNMYTYGKEGMTVPISIFKDQPDPVIGPEHTYPLYFENKLASRVPSTEELVQSSRSGKWGSRLDEAMLDNKVNRTIRQTQSRIVNLTRIEQNRFLKERKVSPAAGGKGAVSPDKAASAGAMKLRDISGKK